MFAGIVEAVEPVLSAVESPGLLRVQIKKPSDFDDIKEGDSISTNGVCLTVESFDLEQITFALAAETLQVLGLHSGNSVNSVLGKKFNLERSLRFGDRIHGHLVTGHVDSLGLVTASRHDGESLFLDFEVKDSVLPFLWKKGSITLNGTSLTVNVLEGRRVGVCLIPETQKRTNLGDLKVGETVTVEPDYMARAMVRRMELSMDVSK
jgi:riboflavin synthase